MSSFQWQARLISAIVQRNREILYITRHANEKHEERQQMEADRNGEKKKKIEIGFRSQQYVWLISGTSAPEEVSNGRGNFWNYFPQAVCRETSGYVCWQVLWDGYTYLGSPGDSLCEQGVLACVSARVLDWTAVLTSKLNKCEFYNWNKLDLIRQKCCGWFCWL